MDRQEYSEITTQERLEYNTALLEGGQEIPEDIPREELPTVFQDRQTSLWYRYNEELKVYDPLLDLPKDEELQIGKYSTERRDYLREKKYPMFVELLLKGELNKHCNEIRQECIEMEQRLMKEMAVSEGLNSELQSRSWLEYAQGMNNLQQRVTEIVMNELIYN